VLLDECVDRRLAQHIVGHHVETVPRMGWAGKRNSELLTLAAADFDVFVTVDRKLTERLDVSQLDLAVAILAAPSNRVVDLLPLMAALLAKLNKLTAGEVVELS
jgi:hypothetical protein